MELIECTKCKQDKFEDEFGADSRSKSGKKSYCKACCAEASKMSMSKRHMRIDDETHVKKPKPGIKLIEGLDIHTQYVNAAWEPKDEGYDGIKRKEIDKSTLTHLQDIDYNLHPIMTKRMIARQAEIKEAVPTEFSIMRSKQVRVTIDGIVSEGSIYEVAGKLRIPMTQLYAMCKFSINVPNRTFEFI